MTQDEIEQILSLGTIDEQIAELLRQQAKAEGEGDATRGREYTSQAGRVVVANPYQAVADMFIRGKAERKAKEAADKAAERRGERDRITRDWLEGALGKKLEPIDIHAMRIGREPDPTPFPQPAMKPATPPVPASVPTQTPVSPAPQMGAPVPPAPPVVQHPPAAAPSPTPAGIVDPQTGEPLSLEALTNILRGRTNRGATGSF